MNASLQCGNLPINYVTSWARTFRARIGATRISSPTFLESGETRNPDYAVRRIVIACRLLPSSDASDRITRVTRKIT